MESSVNSITDRYAKLSQGINPFTNENKYLPTDEYEEFLVLNEQLAGLFPSLTQNYDENGNAILGLSGSVNTVTESIKALVEQEKELAKAKIRENIELYFNGTDEADGAWKALEGRKQVLESAKDDLGSLEDIYKRLMNSNEKVTVGQFHKNLVNKEKKKYIKYIKNNFGEDIANAISDVTSVHIGKGFGGELADLTVDFSKLGLSDSQKEQITKSYDTFYSELLAKQKTAQSEFDSQNSEFSNNAMFWLEDLDFYKDSDKYVKTAIQNLISNIDWSNYSSEELNYDGVKRILQDQILTPFQVACDDPNTKSLLDKALTGLFTLDLSKMSIDDITSQVNSYISTISSIIGEEPTELKTKLGFENIIELETKYKHAIDFAKDKFDGYNPTEFFGKHSINTKEEIDVWQKIAQEVTNVIELEKKYVQSLNTHKTRISPSDKFQNLWDLEEFKDTREEIAKLAKQGKLTASEINSLASENDDLSSILNEVGISSKFAARCFELVCNGANGFSNITESTLALDRALHDMDDALVSATYAKSKYDEAMSADDYNAEFKNYQEAYAAAMESFKSGEYGKQFRASMEYLLGEDSYSMSIEELYKSVKKQGSVFGEEANNGLEFLDKLYAKKEILDDLDSTLKKTSDGGYDFDIKTDDFDNIADALGMTTEEVTACVNALGMFGDYSSYDIEKVKDALDDMAISVSKTGKSTLSLQGVQNILSDLGYEGYEAYQILEKLRSQSDVKILDFEIPDGKNASKKLVNIIDKLKELEAINIDYTGAVNTTSLIENMSAFGMSTEQISEFLNKINELTSYHLDVSNLSDLESIQDYVKGVLGNTDKSSTESMNELSDAEDKAKSKAEDLTGALDNVNSVSMLNVLSGIAKVFNALDKTTDKAKITKQMLEDISSTSISIPTVNSSDTSDNNSGKTTSGKAKKKQSTKKAKADGTFAYANGTSVTLKNDQEALVNEVEKESIVRDGVWSEIPGNAHIEKLKKGDIIFNGRQTEELKRNGRVVSNGGHGEVIGAFASGTIPGVNPATKKKWSSGKKKKKKSDSSDTSKDTTKFQQAIDWCAQSINRLTSLIDNINAKIALTSKSLGKQLKYYKELINKQQKLIKGYEKSENTYKKAYNKALNKLSKADRKKVENGTYTIENFKGKAKSGNTSKAEERYNNIQSALEARDTYLKAQTDLVNAKQQLNEYIETLAGIRWEKANEAVEKLNKNIEVLDAKASNLNGYKSKNENLDEKVKKQYKTVKEQQSAVNKTQSDKDTIDKQALSIKGRIKSKYKTAKRTNANGTLSEDGVTGKQLTLIKQYNLQIKKSNAYKKKLSEINQELAISEQEYITPMNESIATKANNIQQDYENRMSLIDAKENQLNAEIALAEAKGQVASAKYYQLLNVNSKQRIGELESEKEELENQLKGLSEYSDAWYEVKNILFGVDEQLAEETQNAVENITKQIEAVSNLTDAINKNLELHTNSDFYTSLTEGEDYYDKNGMTDVGKSVLAAKYLEYTGKKQQRKNLDKELNEITMKYLQHSISESEMTQLTDEWLKKAQELDKEIINSQNAIGDMLTESYKAQLDGLKEIIDAKKKALSLDKSEYDYQKSIAEKTKSIATLQKQLAMLEGRNDEEANAERQKIQLQLEDAQEDLDDTQYDKYIERVENALDDLSERFSDTIDELSKTLNHVGTIESNIYDLISVDKGSIFKSIRNVFDERGINLNDSGDWLSYMQSLAGNKDKKEDTFGTAVVADKLENQTDYLEKIYEKIPDEKETGKEKTKLSVADVLGKASEQNKKADTSEMSALNKYLVSQGYKPMSTSKMADLASALRSSSAFDNLDEKIKETISSITSASQLNSEKDINASANKNALLKALKFTQKYTKIQEFLDSHLKPGKADNNYGTLNKYLYKTQDGKVLSKEDAVALGKMLGVSDANKNDMIDGKEGKELVEKLKKAGFSKGGIVEVVRRNGDDGLATLKAGEAVLTPPQTDIIKKFAESFDMEKFKEYAKSMDLVTPALDNLREMQLQAMQLPTPDFKSTNTTSVGDIHMTFELPNVIDPQSFIKTIQNNSQVQKTLQNVTVGQLNGNMKFRGSRL